MDSKPTQIEDESVQEYMENYDSYGDMQNHDSDGDMGEERGASDGLPLYEEGFLSPIVPPTDRKRGPAYRKPLTSLVQSTKIYEKGKKTQPKKNRANWSNEALELAIEGLDQGYKFSQVCAKYGIPRSPLRDYLVGRSRGRKMGPKTILSIEEEKDIVEYIHLMVEWEHPMTPLQLKNKVAEITQERVTPFKDGVPGES